MAREAGARGRHPRSAYSLRRPAPERPAAAGGPPSSDPLWGRRHASGGMSRSTLEEDPAPEKEMAAFDCSGDPEPRWGGLPAAPRFYTWRSSHAKVSFRLAHCPGPALSLSSARRGPAVFPAPTAPQSVFGEQIDVRVVNVEAVVTDKQGNRVTGLQAQRFPPARSTARRCRSSTSTRCAAARRSPPAPGGEVRRSRGCRAWRRAARSAPAIWCSSTTSSRSPPAGTRCCAR